MTFVSKKDVWMGLIIWTLIGEGLYLLYEFSFVHKTIIGIAAALGLISFFSVIWFRTYYKVADDKLYIYFGFIKQTIDIETITSFRYTRNPFTAPALSICRIEIQYNQYEAVQLSPREIEAFIQALQKQNEKTLEKSV